MSFNCPSTLDQCTEAVMKLLPRGRAWSNNEGTLQTGTTLWKYWRSFAEILFYFYTRVCDLRREFWCHSIVDTMDDWMKEYGLPDECDPFPDLCVKVAAIGGTRCEYYAEVAARAGWRIACKEAEPGCGATAGTCALAGRARAGATGGQGNSLLTIVVYLGDSPAYQPAKRFLPSLAGRLRGGRRMSCGPSLLPLQCLLSRVIHAEIFTTYEVQNHGPA